MDTALLLPCYELLVRLLEEYTPLKNGDCPDVSRIIRLIYLIRLYIFRPELGSPLRETDIAVPDSPVSSEPDTPLSKPVWRPLMQARLDKWTFSKAQERKTNKSSDEPDSVSPRASVAYALPLCPSIPLVGDSNVSDEILPTVTDANSASSNYGGTSVFGPAEGEDVSPFIAKLHIYLIFITVEMEQVQQALRQLGNFESVVESKHLQRTVVERSRHALNLAEKAVTVVKDEISRDMADLGERLAKILEAPSGTLSV